MIRKVLGLAVCALILSSDAWASPPSLQLPARELVSDPRLPLPTPGGAFYLFTHRAITRPELDRLRGLGLGYLGVAGAHAYGWRRTTAQTREAQTYLRNAPFVAGTAIALPIDKLRSDLLDYLQTAGPEEGLPYPLAVTLWPHTPVDAARALLPEAQEDLRWSSAPDAVVGLQMAAYLPAASSDMTRLDKLMASPFVAAIGFDAPRVSHNESSRTLSNSNQIFEAPYALDGTGVVVGHWDGGRVDTSHPDLAGRVDNLDDGDISSHATHTAGTVLGSGFGDPDARGHAPAATMVALTYFGNTPSERRLVKHLRYHEHDNHSWGQNPDTVSNFGTYNQVGFEFDVDARDLFLLAIKSAGNEGQASEVIVENTGFDSLSPDSTSKNTLVIGATRSGGNLAGFSSRGPTEDGRIKPDLCAVGVQVLSTVPGGSYSRNNGTSMSAPGVTGMLALLSQLYKRENEGRRWAPDMTRGIMIHTARDVWNRGPDYRYGWGHADAAAAADLIVRDAASEGRHLVRGAVREGEVREYTLEVPADTPTLKVTLSWLDAFMNPPEQRLLLNDIDLLLIAPDGTAAHPWSLDPQNPLDEAVRTSTNTRDNVEQVVVDAPAEGTWTVRVTGRSITDPQLFVQGFVLATDFELDRYVRRFRAAFEDNASREIPDNDEAGTTITFEVPDLGTVESVRLYLDIQHEARGNLRVIVEGPDGTRATVESEDGSTRRDIYAIYPDLRSYDDDLTALDGKSSFGTWRVYVLDVNAGDVGQIRSATLEIDTDGMINQAPVARAQADDPVWGTEPGRLMGAGSTDPDGDPLAFSWRQTEGPQIVLEGADTATATFIAPSLSETEAVAFELTVDDRRGGTATDVVTLQILPPNEAPLADAGPDQMVAAKAPVTLDGSASSDPEGDDLTFGWRQLDGPTVELTAPDTAAPSFVAPVPTETVTLRFELEVGDGRQSSVDEVTITVEPPVTPSLEETGGCGCRAERGPARDTAAPSVGILLSLLGLGLFRRRRSLRR